MYMKNALLGQAVSNEVEVARRDLPFEFMLNALRLRDGFELARFAERTGLPLSAVQAPLKVTGALDDGTVPPAAKDRGQTMTAGAFPAAVRPLVP